MQAISPTDVFLFEGFRLDRRGLFRRDEGDAAVPVEIGSRALDVLAVLLAGRDHGRRLAGGGGRGQLPDRPDIGIAARPRYGAQASCIQTVSGRGYRFVAPVTRVERDIAGVGAASR